MAKVRIESSFSTRPIEPSRRQRDLNWVKTYKGGGIGAVDAKEGDRRLDVLVGCGSRGGGVEADLRGNCPLGSGSPGSAEDDLSRQHGDRCAVCGEVVL